jgi:CheY-like chemotaxis protein
MTPSDSPTILVVEDEVLIREDAIDVLEREGFEVLRAGTVGEALAVLDGRSDVSAVFTDVQMPGDRDGVDLARHLARSRPGIAVLVTSGCSFSPPEGLPPASRFVPKPYMPRRVAAILREMMADAQSALAGGIGALRKTAYRSPAAR